MHSPKVSIVIPVYNGSNYVSSAIECALQQTYDNLEVIVVNDGSTDDGKTEAIALSYGDRIRYFCKPNGGVSSALNYGIRQMTGQYFSWLSHDDAYSPDKIKDAIELLCACDGVREKMVAFTGGYFIDTLGNKIGNFHQYFDERHVYDGLDVINIMCKKGTLNGCCMLIPREAFEDAGYFDERLRYSQDSLMWYRIFLSGYSLVSDNLPNVMYRLHGNQASQLQRDLYEHDALVIAKLLAEPLAKADGSGKLLKRYIRRLSKNDCNEAISYLYHYADEHGYLGFQDCIALKAHRILGSCRYRAVTAAKKMLIRVRR